MNPSPTHPDMDTLGSNRPDTFSTKLYSSNPYWNRNKATAPEESATSPAKGQSTPTEMADALPSHLIAALEVAVDKLGQAQRDQLTGQLMELLPGLSATLMPTIEQHLEKLVPKVVKVEQPGQSMLRLVRYLTGGMVVAGLLIGGLLFAWLQTRQQRDSYAVGYWQHRYVVAQVSVSRSATMQRLLQRADILYRSAQFNAELKRLESILDARQQQYQLHLKEQELIRSAR